MSRAWASGSTPEWRAVRWFVLQRDRFRCQLQLPGCTTRATQAHHAGAREVTGDDPAHLLAACQHCNGSAGDPRRHDPPPTPRTRW